MFKEDDIEELSFNYDTKSESEYFSSQSSSSPLPIKPKKVLFKT